MVLLTNMSPVARSRTSLQIEFAMEATSNGFPLSYFVSNLPIGLTKSACSGGNMQTSVVASDATGIRTPAQVSGEEAEVGNQRNAASTTSCHSHTKNRNPVVYFAIQEL